MIFITLLADAFKSIAEYVTPCKDEGCLKHLIKLGFFYVNFYATPLNSHELGNLALN